MLGEECCLLLGISRLIEDIRYYQEFIIKEQTPFFYYALHSCELFVASGKS